MLPCHIFEIPVLDESIDEESDGIKLCKMIAILETAVRFLLKETNPLIQSLHTNIKIRNVILNGKIKTKKGNDKIPLFLQTITD